jgi:hypothetical protein
MNVNNHEEEQKHAAVVNLKTFSSYKLNYVEPHSSIQLNRDQNNIIERADLSIEEIFNSIDNKNIEINEIDDQRNSATNSIHKIDSLKTDNVQVEQRTDYFERVDDYLLKSDDTDANQDVWGRHHDSYPKDSTTTMTASVTWASSTTASRGYSFFARVDELRAYKAKHGHLNVRCEEDQYKSLYNFCRNLRRS